MVNFIQIYLLAFTFVGLVYCQSQNEIQDEMEKKIKELEIPDLSSFNASILPTDEIEKVLRDKCEKNGGPDAYDNVKAKQEYFQECVSGFVDLITIQEELDEAAKTGSMELVFGKYCAQYPTKVKTCLDELQDSITPCFEDEEVPTLNKSFTITDKIVNFVCDKQGDRMAMFVAEGGVECLNATRELVQDCVNSTFAEKILEAMPELSEGKFGPLPPMILKEEYSKEYDQLHLCVRNALETCEESTPANVADALFKYVRKLMFKIPKNSATSVLATSLVLVTAIITRYI